MRFSNRTPRDLTPNSIAVMLIRFKGRVILDLTESNPTNCGFNYPSSIFEILGHPSSLVYEPYSSGLPQARQAVSDFLRSKGQNVKPENILLTASTSEAYSFLFKLLGDASNSFLVPTPGYPLLDHLLRLEGMKMVPYSFQTTENWPVDIKSVEKIKMDDCQGLVVVNPNNPTGAFLSGPDLEALGRICEKKQWAYISDEVFADFAYPGQTFKPWVPPNTLSFRLGGLSKSLGLPQLKLSWIVVDGPSEMLEESLERLELIADTYLSVNTPVQRALKDLFNFAPSFQKQVMERVLSNRKILEKITESCGSVKLWPTQGGWYALLEITRKDVSEERIVLDLIEKYEVLAYPGAFYGFQERVFLVLCLLRQPDIFQEAANRIQTHLKSL